MSQTVECMGVSCELKEICGAGRRAEVPKVPESDKPSEWFLLRVREGGGPSGKCVVTRSRH